MIKMNNQNSEYELSEYVLLLGAGFTKNFGGLLAEEMWTHIFNHEEIQAQPRIKKLMLNNFDYEDIYYSVLENLKDKESLFLPIEFTDEEKKAIKNATNMHMSILMKLFEINLIYLTVYHLIKILFHLSKR
ncbi:MAG TPA: hypothetical protein HA262_12645 [Methanosarcina sp.]|jgi:CRISPR/Cas system-associated endonuclease Cas3-HD|nr:hypothetical protein [Methanosarcina sp.]